MSGGHFVAVCSRLGRGQANPGRHAMSIVKLPPTEAAPVRSNGHTNGHTNLARVAVGLAVLASERLVAEITPKTPATPPTTAQRAAAISVGLVQGASVRVAHTLVALADYSAHLAADGAHLVSTIPAPRPVRAPIERA